MVVHVVHQRHTRAPAQRQQTPRGEAAVVVLERQSLPHPRAQELESALQTLGGLPQSTRGSSAVQTDHVGSDQLGDHRLMLQLLHRRSYHCLPLRVEHHELVRVQAQPDVVGPGQRAGPFERSRDCSRGIQPLQGVAGDRMGGEGKDLAVDPEGADAELVAALDGGGQRIGIVRRNLSEVSPRDWGLETRDVSMRRSAEADGRVEELAAETPAGSGVGSREYVTLSEEPVTVVLAPSFHSG